MCTCIVMAKRKILEASKVAAWLSTPSDKGQDLYRERAERAKKLGIALVDVGISKANLSRLQDRAPLYGLLWDGREMQRFLVPSVHALYDRTNMTDPEQDLVDNLIAALQAKNVRPVNGRALRKLCYDKWDTYLALEKSGIDMPETELYDPEKVAAFIQEFPIVFLKPRSASHGDGQIVVKAQGGYFVVKAAQEHRCGSAGKASDVIQNLIVSPETYIMQEGIRPDTTEGSRKYDIRSLWQRGTDGRLSETCFYLRVAAPGADHTNITHAKTPGEARDPRVVFSGDYEGAAKLIHAQGKRIISALTKTETVGEIGIDFVFSEGDFELFNLELNTKPGSNALRQFAQQDPYWRRRLEAFLTKPLSYLDYIIETYS